MHGRMEHYGRGGCMGYHHHNHYPGGGFKRGSGAQTFRRGRLLDFLERLLVKKETLEKQMKQDQYQEIKSVISGELKAVETVINEFVLQFDLEEIYDYGEEIRSTKDQKDENDSE